MSAQRTADTAKDVPSTGAKCSLTASFPPGISPLSEQQGEGRDLGCEWETEAKGSGCSLTTQHQKSKPEPPAPAHPGITRARVLSEDLWSRLLESQPPLLKTHISYISPAAAFQKHAQFHAGSQRSGLRFTFGSCTWQQCVRGRNTAGVDSGGDPYRTCSEVCSFTIQTF